jgi:hypothetical protein
MSAFNHLFILILVLTGNACSILSPKDIETGLDPAFQLESGSDAATIEISRPDKLVASKASYIVLENDTIVGTLTNGGSLSWKSTAGSKNIQLESVRPIFCRIFPGRDGKCFEDKKNLYVRTDQDKKIPAIKIELKPNQTCKINFEPNFSADHVLTFTIEP